MSRLAFNYNFRKQGRSKRDLAASTGDVYILGRRKRWVREGEKRVTMWPLLYSHHHTEEPTTQQKNRMIKARLSWERQFAPALVAMGGFGIGSSVYCDWPLIGAATSSPTSVVNHRDVISGHIGSFCGKLVDDGKGLAFQRWHLLRVRDSDYTRKEVIDRLNDGLTDGQWSAPSPLSLMDMDGTPYKQFTFAFENPHDFIRAKMAFG